MISYNTEDMSFLLKSHYVYSTCWNSTKLSRRFLKHSELQGVTLTNDTDELPGWISKITNEFCDAIARFKKTERTVAAFQQESIVREWHPFDRVLNDDNFMTGNSLYIHNGTSTIYILPWSIISVCKAMRLIAMQITFRWYNAYQFYASVH